MDQSDEFSRSSRVADVDASLKTVNLGIAAAMAPVGLLFLIEFGVVCFLFIIGVFTYWLIGLAFARRVLGLYRWNIGLVLIMTVCAVGASTASGGTSSPILFFAGVIAIVGRAFFPSRVVTVSSGAGIVAAVGLIEVVTGREVALIPFLCAAVLAAYLPFIIDRLVALEECQRRRAVLDQLTGCFNRHALATRTAELEAHSDRTGHGVAVIVFDIDHFKAVNDEHGHAVGDRILANVAYVARKCLRRFELLYRIGGEEFAVLLPGIELDDAVAIAERLRSAIETTSTTGVEVTASFGVADGAAPLDVDQIIHEADSRLYDAKAAGRNRVAASALQPGALPVGV